jgi:hypothetical protein
LLFVVRKCAGETLLRRPRHRWEDNIRMELKEIGWESVDWIHVAQDRDCWGALVNMVVNLQVSKRAGNFLASCVTINF